MSGLSFWSGKDHEWVRRGCPPAERGIGTAQAIIWLSLLCLADLIPTAGSEEIPPRFYSVLVSAEVRTAPASVTLNWPADSNALSYQISRKTADQTSWTPTGLLDGAATSFDDPSVSTASVYEYQIIKTATTYTGYGYIRAGIEAPLVDQRGKVILLVADTYAADLDAELRQLQQDLVGDGWMVLRHQVSSGDPVTHVKSLIQAEYERDPANVRALFLFGRVPVPYSGVIAPDGHPNHRGAWPADVYYGTFQGAWTDSSVTSTNAERVRNWNVPADGKFDQDSPPSDVTLQIGRVDLSDLTCFSNKTPSRSEKDLLRQYLVKDHRFRHGLLTLERRGLICDNFADKGRDPIGSSGWRNFSGFFGANNITEVGWSNYFPVVTAQSYLWTFGSGGGQYYTCTGVGSSDDFALQDIKAVFTMWLGSYFGDWDNESNFLRAPLGSSTYTLTSSYSGFPQWLYHPMALGETAGYCASLTQNNGAHRVYPPFNPGTGLAHVALLGDPTLRMHPVLPPAKLTISTNARGLALTWNASADKNLRGYHVYRAPSPFGPFVRITGDIPILQTSFTERSPDQPQTYMVRAIKLEESSSGTYFNASQGIFATAGTTGPVSNPVISIVGRDGSDVHLRVAGQPGQGFQVDTSEDLSRWENLISNTFSSNIFDLFQPVLPSSPQRYFRSRPKP